MNSECRSYYSPSRLLSLLLRAFFPGRLHNPEKAKAEHLSKGEAYLKDSKFQEASLEFRNALQIDDKLPLAIGAWHMPMRVAAPTGNARRVAENNPA